MSIARCQSDLVSGDALSLAFFKASKLVAVLPFKVFLSCSVLAEALLVVVAADVVGCSSVGAGGAVDDSVGGDVGCSPVDTVGTAGVGIGGVSDGAGCSPVDTVGTAGGGVGGAGCSPVDVVGTAGAVGSEPSAMMRSAMAIAESANSNCLASLSAAIVACPVFPWFARAWTSAALVPTSCVCTSAFCSSVKARVSFTCSVNSFTG